MRALASVLRSGEWLHASFSLRWAQAHNPSLHEGDLPSRLAGIFNLGPIKFKQTLRSQKKKSIIILKRLPFPYTHFFTF